MDQCGVVAFNEISMKGLQMEVSDCAFVANRQWYAYDMPSAHKFDPLMKIWWSLSKSTPGWPRRCDLWQWADKAQRCPKRIKAVHWKFDPFRSCSDLCHIYAGWNLVEGDLWQKLKRRFKIYGLQTFAWAGRQTFAFAMQLFVPRNPSEIRPVQITEIVCYTQKCSLL